MSVVRSIQTLLKTYSFTVEVFHHRYLTSNLLRFCTIGSFSENCYLLSSYIFTKPSVHTNKTEYSYDVLMTPQTSYERLSYLHYVRVANGRSFKEITVFCHVISITTLLSHSQVTSSGLFIVNLERNLHITLVFSFLTLSK